MVRLVQQAPRRRAHHERRHEVLEHRPGPGNERGAPVYGRQGATEMEPMRRWDVALGNGDEAGESCLRRQQIVTTRVETVIGHAVPDREELPRRVEEKAKLHGVEHRLRELGEGRKTADQRSGGCGSTREALDEGIDVGQGIAACGALGRQARAERRELAYGGLTVLRRIGQGRERAKQDASAVQPDACSGGSAPYERVVPTDQPRPGKRHVKIARVTLDTRLHGLRPGKHLCIGAVHPVPQSACAQCPPRYARGPQVQ